MQHDNHYLLVPDVDAEIEHIFRTSTVPANYRYSLTSVNWLFNDRVIDVFNEEYKNSGLNGHVSEYVLALLHVIYTFLTIKKCDVVHNRFMQFLDFDAVYSAFTKKRMDVQSEPINDINLSSVVEVKRVFSKTLHALEHAFRLENSARVEFIHRGNVYHEGDGCPSVPVSVHLCPWYYVITFIH